MEFSKRQEMIASIVREQGPITGQAIAEQLEVTRAALRSDLAILTMTGVLDARPKLGYFYIGEPAVNPVARELRRIKVGEALSRAVVVTHLTGLYDTVMTMFTEDVGTILVSEDNYLQGVVSRKDLLRVAIGKGELQHVPVSMIMTPVSKVIFAEVDESIVDAAERMIDYEIDCLPVVSKETADGKKKLRIIGRISKTNITRLFVECGRGKV